MNTNNLYIMSTLSTNLLCNSTKNPGCREFGGRQIFEVIYLIFISVFGSSGNLLVILSVLFKKRLYKHGNIFIVNLAVADFYVSLFKEFEE